MTFDRLVYIDRLKDAGVDEAIARAHAEALREALLETVATKTDLSNLKTELVQKFDQADRRIDQLDRKIEITARDLVIKGAGGLALIASLMIGLKLLG